MKKFFLIGIFAAFGCFSAVSVFAGSEDLWAESFWVERFCALTEGYKNFSPNVCATYFQRYDTQLHTKLDSIVASRDQRFSPAKKLALIKRVQQIIFQKRIKANIPDAKYALLSYLQAFFGQEFPAAETSEETTIPESTTSDNDVYVSTDEENPSSENTAQVRTSAPNLYTEETHTVYGTLSADAQPFVASVDIRADLEPLILKSLKVHHSVAPGHSMSKGVRKFVLYAPDGQTIIGEESTSTLEDYTIIDNIGAGLSGGAFVFEGQVTLYLKALPQPVAYLEDLGPLVDAKVAFTAMEVINTRGKNIPITSPMSDRSENFSVVANDISRATLVDEVALDGQIVNVDSNLFNGNIKLAIMALPVEGNTDEFSLLVRTLQPAIQASAWLTLTNITIERVGGTSNNAFAYADLANIVSTNPADYTNGADPVNLSTKPGNIAYFLLRADVSGADTGESIKVMFNESTLRYSTDQRQGSVFVGDIITPQDFSTERMIYGR